MALGDLFKSKKERERDEAKKRRKAFREAENAVDVVKDRIGKLKKAKPGSTSRTARRRRRSDAFRPAGPVRCSCPSWR